MNPTITISDEADAQSTPDTDEMNMLAEDVFDTAAGEVESRHNNVCC
jgi:hypothetical protein